MWSFLSGRRSEQEDLSPPRGADDEYDDASGEDRRRGDVTGATTPHPHTRGISLGVGEFQMSCDSQDEEFVTSPSNDSDEFSNNSSSHCDGDLGMHVEGLQAIEEEDTECVLDEEQDGWSQAIHMAISDAPQAATADYHYHHVVEDGSESSSPEHLNAESTDQNFLNEEDHSLQQGSPKDSLDTPASNSHVSTESSHLRHDDDDVSSFQSSSYFLERCSATAIVPTAVADENQLAILRSKFVFLSEEPSVPTHLHQLQASSVRRRDEFQTNVHDLELRVAALTAGLAHEQMDRERVLADLVFERVYTPLEQAMDAISLERDKARVCGTNWMQLEGKLSVLDSHMTRSIHVELQDAKRQELGRIQDQIEQELEPALALQAVKTDRREGSLFRRLEDTAGSMAGRYQEERATRVAACARAVQQMRILEDLDHARAEPFLDRLAQVRELLVKEGEERREEDASIWQRLAARERLLNEVILESVVGDLDD
jgi:hypothetical protein